MDLPWLQAVQDKAVHRTSNLDRDAEAAAVEAEDGAAGPDITAGETDMQAQPETEPQTDQPAEPTGDKDEPPPPWVVSILEPTASPGTEQSYEPEELSHIMPWAHGTPGGEGEEEASIAQPGQLAEPGNPGLPPWLGDVTVQETLQSLPPSEQKVTEPVEINLEGIEPFVPPAEETAQSAEPAEEVPEWLRTMGGASQAPRSSGLMRSSPLGGSAQTTDSFGTPPTRNVPVKPPRAGAVETLATLLQPIAPEASRRVIPGDAFMPGGRVEASARRAGWRGALLPDGLIYLLVLAVLLAVLIVKPPFGEITAPSAPGVLQFFNAVEGVPSGKPVLIVYDWDASRSGEMSVLARAVMQHIMQRKLPFVTVSTVPQGPGFAQQITDDMASDTQSNFGYTYGNQYLVLGYLPGNEAALKSLVTDFEGTLPLDYVNSRRLDTYPLVQGGSVSKIEDFALIVDLASSEAELRNWIEQVASRTNVPVVAAVSQGLDPLARPYLGVPGAKLSAVVSGVAGANQYSRQLELAGRGGGALDSIVDLNTRLNAQSVAALLVSLVIVAAFVAFGMRRIMRR
jgi:hypothetical protein